MMRKTLKCTAICAAMLFCSNAEAINWTTSPAFSHVSGNVYHSEDTKPEKVKVIEVCSCGKCEACKKEQERREQNQGTGKIIPVCSLLGLLFLLLAIRYYS